MKWSVATILLVIALNTNARSLAPVDVPDPPKSAPARNAPLPQQVVRQPVAPPPTWKDTSPAKTKQPSLLDALTGSCEDACHLGLEREGCKCLQDSPTRLCKLACEMTHGGPDCECTVISHARPEGLHEVRAVVADKIVISVIRPVGIGSIIEEEVTTPNLVATTRSTTLSPIEEFCKEACEEGVGGPECDCADHPIG